MRVPLTVADFLDRAETAFAESVAVVDEPAPPAPPVPTTTYGELARRVRAWQAGLDGLGIRAGERVAVVSHNSARLMELLHAVPASGRICVPINFRLDPDEVRYIVGHSGASVLLVDAELDEALQGVAAPHRFVLGAPDLSHVIFPVIFTVVTPAGGLAAVEGRAVYLRAGPVASRSCEEDP